MDWRLPGRSGLQVVIYINANLSFLPSFPFFFTRNHILSAAFGLPPKEEAEGAIYPK